LSGDLLLSVFCSDDVGINVENVSLRILGGTGGFDVSGVK
jgi:hypothetical protein